MRCESSNHRSGRHSRQVLIAIAAAFLAPVALAEEQTSAVEPIVVTGERERQAEIAADQADSITLPSRIDMPMARHYQPICIRTSGIMPEFAELLASRISENVKALGLPSASASCAANVWIVFAKDSKAELARLKKSDPDLFAQLKSFEVDRVFSGNGAAQVMHVNEVRGVDGRQIPRHQLFIPGLPPIEAGFNSQYQVGRTKSTVRTDIVGTLVIFDRQRADGRTVRQLADYATMRILAPLQDFAAVEPGAVPTILHLFANGADAPTGLTNFDWAYLSAYYKLDRGARAPAVHDAVRRAMLDGVGQKLSDAADGALVQD